nr:peroxidase P7-like [Ipomoea batatas]
MGGSLLRLHFHDCFVNKNALANNNSARGFEVIDRIKLEVDRVCGRPVVSCADILAVAARDSVVALGGPMWEVKLGRRDSTTASKDAANARGDSNLASLDPTPALFDTKYFNNLVGKKGLLESDQALFSGGQTDDLVKSYSQNLGVFSKDFANSMVKMGDIKPLTGDKGQIRLDCRRVN